MLFSKNLISQDKSVDTYNSFVRQINNLQKEEQIELDRRLKAFEKQTDDIEQSLVQLYTARKALINQIKLLEVLIYRNTHY